MLGFNAISEQPIATEIFEGNVTIGVTANELTLSIGQSTVLIGALVPVTGEELIEGTPEWELALDQLATLDAVSKEKGKRSRPRSQPKFVRRLPFEVQDDSEPNRLHLFLVPQVD